MVIGFFKDAEYTKHLNIYHFDIDKLRSDFRQCFKNIDAAGGVVKNQKGEYLLIYRRGKWDLPKGKLDKGEEEEEAAIREVTEETGLSGFEEVTPLLATYHIYKEKEVLVLKRVMWYDMLYKGNQKPVPQTEEDITKIKWFNQRELFEAISNTYLTILDVLKYRGRTSL